MLFVHNTDEEEEVEGDGEGEEIDAENVSLDDDLLAELDPLDDEVQEPLTEGFGEVPEEEEKALDKVLEKADDDDGAEELEEDAEDVDFDTFDDVDEF